MKNRIEQIKEVIQSNTENIVIIYTSDPEAIAVGTPISDDEVKNYKNAVVFNIDRDEKQQAVILKAKDFKVSYFISQTNKQMEK